MVKLNDGMIISVNGAVYTLHEMVKDYEYTVVDEEGNLLNCIIEDGMPMADIADEIKIAARLPRETPKGDIIIKHQRYIDMTAKIGRTGGSSLIITITEQAKALGLGRGDLVKVTLERVDN